MESVKELEQMNGYYITKQKDIKAIKVELHNKQNGICPLLYKEIHIDKMVVDHKHKRKTDEATVDNGLGMIRGALEFRANSFEGKAWNFYKRLGLDQDVGFSDLLRRLADFHDNAPCTVPILHYTEVPKRKKVKISEWNRIKKYFLELHPRKRTIPKKPTYVNDDFLNLLKITEVHIQNLKDEKELRKQERLENKRLKGL